MPLADSSEQLKTVKDYIAKYNLEDELSNAVNHAIKLDSDDPYRVISDYLRQFAKVCVACAWPWSASSSAGGGGRARESLTCACLVRHRTRGTKATTMMTMLWLRARSR